MKRIHLFFLISTLIVFTTQAQVAEKLTGTIIGTTDCVDYTDFSLSTTVNTAANLFDNDFNTIFATYQRSGGWAGLDLGKKYIITKVAFCPRSDWNSRMVLGMFEGANNPDFGDAVPLTLISEAPAYSQFTEKTVNCSRGFRYVRYIGPSDVRCNVAELAFFGYEGKGDDKALHQLTNLPTVTIHTKDAADIVEKEVYLKGIVSIISENGTQIYTDSLDVRGRGNASWGFPKKPYRMKLYKKTNLLGMPAKEKNWTLINNYGDKTLMRNLLAFDLSRRMEMPYTSVGIAVDVVLNGEYKGTYQLCDQIEVASGRVEVEKMNENDVSLPNLTGGYFLEMDAYAYTELSWFESAQKKIPVTIKYPKDDEIVPAQTNYIVSHFNAMETALFGYSFANPTNGYRKYIDVPTFIRHFLVGEISGNTDTYWSTFLYKKRNNDLFYVGPVWDFDLAYENDNRTYPINTNPEWIYSSKGSAANGVRDFVNRIMSDSWYYQELRTVYAHYRDNGKLHPDSLLAVVNAYSSELNQSQQLNFKRWDIMNQVVHQNPRTYGSYEAEVENVRNYIRERIAWMDKKLNYVPKSDNDDDDDDDDDDGDDDDDYTPKPFYIWSEKGVLHIENVDGKADVEVFGILGQKVVSKQITNRSSISLYKGTYIIRITSGNGKVNVYKYIVP